MVVKGQLRQKQAVSELFNSLEKTRRFRELPVVSTRVSEFRLQFICYAPRLFGENIIEQSYV